MIKQLLIVTAFVFGLLPHAQAQLTNQVAITPLINLTLLECSDAASTNRFNSSDKILFMVSSVDGKGHVFALLRPEQSFIFELHDAKGRSVAKTDNGLKMSKSVDITKGPKDLEIRHQGVGNQLNYLFVPDKYFAIPEKGIYTLDLQIRAWVQKTNNQYGVVVSPPLRVQVEKR
jgi:hypothetical protein